MVVAGSGAGRINCCGDCGCCACTCGFNAETPAGVTGFKASKCAGVDCGGIVLSGKTISACAWEGVAELVGGFCCVLAPTGRIRLEDGNAGVRCASDRLKPHFPQKSACAKTSALHLGQ